MKEKFQQGALIEILRVVGRNQAGFNGGGADAVVINAPAIILYLYIYVVAAMVSAHRHVAHFALARMVAIFAALQAVGHGIAHQVDERIGHLLDDVVVEFGLGAGQGEFHLLVAGFGGVAHRPRDARVEIADRHHARLGDLVLQPVGQLGELVNVGIHAADETIELGENFGDVGGNFRQRAREDAEIVVAIHLQFAELSQRRIVGVRVAGEASAVRIGIGHAAAPFWCGAG